MLFKRSTKQRKFAKRVPFRRGLKRVLRKGVKTRATSELITFMAPNQMPFPPRYRTKFVTRLQGNIAGGGANAAGQFYIKMNSPLIPFDNGVGNGLASALYANVAPASRTLTPAGYAQLVNSTLYSKWRVYASHVVISAIPQGIADTIQFTITPSGLTSSPSTAPIALEQPYTKAQIFQANRFTKGLRNYMTQHKLVGCTKRAIEDDLSDHYAGSYASDPTHPLYWVINWSTIDAVAVANPVVFDIKVVHYMELWSETNASLTEV